MDGNLIYDGSSRSRRRESWRAHISTASADRKQPIGGTGRLEEHRISRNHRCPSIVHDGRRDRHGTYQVGAKSYNLETGFVNGGFVLVIL